MALAPDVLLRILIGIFMESLVFTVCLAAIGIILYRFKRNNKPQLQNMGSFLILYALAIAASITGKILTYVMGDYSLDTTEWGLFTNWSFSLGFISLSLYFQLEVSWQLFPPKIRNHRIYALAGSIVLFLIVFAIPRYGIYGQEIPIYAVKFILVFIYELAASLYYMFHSYKVYTFIRNKFLQKRILAGLLMYASIIFVFIFLMISSIYGSITGIFYTWGYFISVSFMLSAAISAYFSVRHGKESDREDLDEELQKLLKNPKGE